MRRQAGVTHTHFIAEKRYSETIVPQLLRAAVVVIGVPLSDIMGFVGNSFVEVMATKFVPVLSRTCPIDA